MLFVTVGMGWRRQGRGANAFPRIGVPPPRVCPESAAHETHPSAECSATSRTAPRTHACAEAHICVDASRGPTGRASGRSWKMGHPVTGQSRISRGSCGAGRQAPGGHAPVEPPGCLKFASGVSNLPSPASGGARSKASCARRSGVGKRARCLHPRAPRLDTRRPCGD